jgi:hypothetical protein
MGTLTLLKWVSPWLCLCKEVSNLYFEDLNFMFKTFTSNPPKSYNVYKKPTPQKGSGSYPNGKKFNDFLEGLALWRSMVEKFVWGLKIISCSDCHKHVHVGAGHGECPTPSCHMNIHGGKDPLNFEIYTVYGNAFAFTHFANLTFPFCKVHFKL